MNIKKISGLLVIATGFFLTTWLYESYTSKRFSLTMESLKRVVTSYIWEYNRQGLESIAEVLLRSGFVYRFAVYDEHGEKILDTESLKYLSWLDRLLYNLGLVKGKLVNFPLIYSNIYIGNLYISYLDKNIYIVALNFTLFLAIAFLWLQHLQILEVKARLEKAIKDLHKAEEVLVNAEKMASLGRVIANISHDIKTPVGVIYTAVTHMEKQIKDIGSLYEKGELTETKFRECLEEAEELLDIIEKNAYRVSELLNSFKKVSAHGVSNVKMRIDLCAYIKDTIKSLEPMVKKEGHSIELECESGIEITTVPGAISQILTNLIENSLKHGFKDRRNGKIKITVKDEGNEVAIIYADNGAGMPEDVRKKIFEPFFTTDLSGGSTGIGMSIVYNLVKNVLNGEIELESQPQKGVKFTIRIPKFSLL